MARVARIAPLDLENGFHAYDRVLRENLALRKVHGPLDGDADRPPTGAPPGVLVAQNARMREALERRGVPIPRVHEGSVQPTSLLASPRWHIPADDPEVCSSCGARSRERVCGCGRILRGGPAPRPGWWYRHFGSAATGRSTMPDPWAPFRPAVRWDVAIAWLAGVPIVLVCLFWLLQPAFR